jgi:hypothetical protein
MNLLNKLREFLQIVKDDHADDKMTFHGIAVVFAIQAVLNG